MRLFASVAFALLTALCLMGAAPASDDAADAEARALVKDARTRAGAKASETAVKAAANDALAALGTEALLLSDADQEFWALKSFFSGDVEGLRLRQIGAWFERRGKRWFVRNALAGSPAAEAGLKRGDEVVSVNGKALEPVRSFVGLRPNAKATLVIRRLAYEKPQTIVVGTRVESVQESLLRAMQASRHVYDFDRVKVGYLWLPSATHPAFRHELDKAAEDFARDTDAMVLDLRDSFGGVDLAYLDPFFDLEATRARFAKPLVVLVNGGTRSGKERLAAFLKLQKRAVLVGERTAGAPQMGKILPLDDNKYLIYRAVTKPTREEGRGIQPDVGAENGLMWAAGADEQLGVALKAALAAAKR